MKTSRSLLFCGALLLLAGCGASPVVTGAGVAGFMYLTKDNPPLHPNLAFQMPQHESWCYQTLADVQCYANPQDTEPDRLVNVDPPSRYPMTRDDYAFLLE